MSLLTASLILGIFETMAERNEGQSSVIMSRGVGCVMMRKFHRCACSSSNAKHLWRSFTFNLQLMLVHLFPEFEYSFTNTEELIQN